MGLVLFSGPRTSELTLPYLLEAGEQQLEIQATQVAPPFTKAKDPLSAQTKTHLTP